MPRDLASDPTKTVFDYGAIVSPPRDWDRWEALVRELAAHLVDRYGRDEVRRWAFEVWNEANLEVFWSGHARRVLPPLRRQRPGREVGRRLAAWSAARPRPPGSGSTSSWRIAAPPARRSTSSAPTPTATRRSTCGRSARATASRACRSGGPSGARTPPTSTRCTTRRGAPPTSCAAWHRPWAAPRRSPTGPSPTTSRSWAARRGCCTAGSGCSPSATCASRAGGACGCSSSSCPSGWRSRSRRRRGRHGPGHRIARRRRAGQRSSPGTARST